MSNDDRTQALLEIDFCRSRLPYLWVKYKTCPHERQSYRNLIDAALLLLDHAVSVLLACEGVEPLSSEEMEGVPPKH